jgi:hypothetical protein
MRNNEEKTPRKPREITGGDRKMKGIETGVPFSKENQPSIEAKKEGWAKKKKAFELVQAVLDLSFKGKKGSAIKKMASDYFGISEEDITMEVMLVFRQVEKAIQKSDTKAFTAIMDRAFGKPKERVDLNTGETFYDFLRSTSVKDLTQDIEAEEILPLDELGLNSNQKGEAT